MYAMLVLSFFDWMPPLLRVPVLAVIAVFISVLLFRFAMMIVKLILDIIDAIPFI
jgi:hypothetical protein